MVTGEMKATLNVKEVAELLGVHTNTVYTYLASKQIPAIRLGRRWLISRNAVMKWLESDDRISDSEFQSLIHGGKSK